jgi:hypothetical protein
MRLEISPEVAAIVRAAWCHVEPVVVRDMDPRLDAPLRDAAAAMRQSADADTTVGLCGRTWFTLGAV